MQWNLDDWTILKAEHFELLSSYIRSATERGIYYKDQRLIQCFKKYMNSKQCLFKTEHDTLLLARHFKYINNKIFKLMIPPIHLHGDEQVELQALLQCLKKGIDSNVTKEYAIKHGLEFSTVSQFVGGREVIYEKDAMNLEGKDYRKLRYERNRFKKLLETEGITLVLDHPYDDLRKLNEKWIALKGKDYGEFGYVIENRRFFHPHIRNFTLLSEGLPIASQLYVSFTDHTWYCSASITDFEHPHSLRVQRSMKIEVFNHVEGLERILTGGWTEEGLRESKTTIPHKILTKVRARGYSKLDADYWQRIELLKGKPAKKPKKPKKPSPALFFDV